MIFETLNKLINNETQRKQPAYTYLDETDNKIKERPLKLDSAGASAYINPAKLIHDSFFHF